MLDADDLRIIKKEIEKQLSVLLFAQTGTTTKETEIIEHLYPSMPNTKERPVAHTYGISSRAPRGTISVVGRFGSHLGNVSVIGHRDKNRPEVQEGEVKLYNQYGQVIYLQNGAIRIGTADTTDPAVVGNELKLMLQTLLDLLARHTHISRPPGFPTSEPIEDGEFNDIKSDFVDNDEILSQRVFIKKETT